MLYSELTSIMCYIAYSINISSIGLKCNDFFFFEDKTKNKKRNADRNTNDKSLRGAEDGGLCHIVVY